jgi:poly-gamma-glutamate capsule biosynthesis protein CapA/YwtB (metallophosphatase superfamily)
MSNRDKSNLIVLGMACFIATLAPTQRAHADETIDIVIVGDTGFNSAGARVTPEGGYKQGQLVRIEEALSGIRHELSADIVLANLETAVTARNDLPGVSKRFTFRTHPKAIEAFIDAGINAFSLANNHALDYRQRGAGQTLLHLEQMRTRGLLAFPGLGRTREESAAAHQFSLGATPVAIASIGIGGWGLPTTGPKAGMLTYPADFETVSTALRGANAELRILGVHYGREFQPATSVTSRARFRSAIAPDGLTIIAGHHKHIATGAEMFETPKGGIGLIFYGLGNFLHLGMQNMGRHDLCHDFGLLGRVRVARADDGSLSLVSVRVVPLTDMHRATKPLAPEPAALRVAVLNRLSAQLDAPERGATGLQFRVQEDGSGLWCNPHAEAGACSEATAPTAVTQSMAARIARACRRVLTR